MWGLSAALLAYVLATTDLDHVIRSVLRVELPAVLGVIAFSVFFGFLWETWNVRYLLRIMGHPMRYRDLAILKGFSCLMHLVNYGLGTLLLSHSVDRKEGGGFLRTVGALLVLGIVDAFDLALLCVASGVAGAAFHQDAAAAAVLPLATVVLAGGVLGVFFWQFEDRLPWLHWLTRASFFGVFRTFRAPTYLRFVVLRLPLSVMHVLVDYAVLRLFGVDVPLLAFVSVYPAVVFVAALPVAVSGLGSGQVAARALMLGLVAAQFPDRLAATATVDAFSMTVVFVALGLQVVLGLVCAPLYWRFLFDRTKGAGT